MTLPRPRGKGRDHPSSTRVAEAGGGSSPVLYTCCIKKMEWNGIHCMNMIIKKRKWGRAGGAGGGGAGGVVSRGGGGRG